MEMGPSTSKMQTFKTIKSLCSEMTRGFTVDTRCCRLGAATKLLRAQIYFAMNTRWLYVASSSQVCRNIQNGTAGTTVHQIVEKTKIARKMVRTATVRCTFLLCI